MNEIKLTHNPSQCCECVPHLEAIISGLRDGKPQPSPEKTCNFCGYKGELDHTYTCKPSQPKRCKHKTEYSWRNCDKPHEEPKGMAWRKPSQPERCVKEDGYDQCSCGKHKPDAAVEAKIEELHREYMCQLERGGGSYAVVETMIRELVALAREGL